MLNMIPVRTGRWTQSEVGQLAAAHAKGDLATEDKAQRWAMDHQRTFEEMHRKLVEIGLERPRVTKGELKPLTDLELITEIAGRLAAKGVSADQSAALLGLIKGVLLT